MIVADTNLVAAFILRGAATAAAFAVRARDRNWVAPRLLRSELLGALSKYVVISRSLDRDEAVKAYRRGLNLVEFPEDSSDPVDVFNICASSGLTSYDAEFVAIALERNIKLVSLDSAILKAHPDIAMCGRFRCGPLNPKLI